MSQPVKHVSGAKIHAAGFKPYRTNIFDSNPWREKMPTDLEKRPGFGKLGKPALLNVNSYEVTAFPNKTVYQYDVSVKDSSMCFTLF